MGTGLIYTIILVIIFAGFLYLRLNRAKIKGAIGEKRVSIILSRLPNDEYIVVNDIMLKVNNRTTQIDHVVVSTHGIFVIETKSYKGWIFGHSDKRYWTQNIWGNKYTLYNPIMQNRTHIKFLINKFDILRDKQHFVYPMVVFVGASRIRLSGDCDCVMCPGDIIPHIKSYQNKVMSFGDCNYIATILNAYNVEDKNERQMHYQNVRQIANMSNYRCPKCGGTLVHRTGKYGPFYGCANYPQCKYTERL